MIAKYTAYRGNLSNSLETAGDKGGPPRQEGNVSTMYIGECRGSSVKSLRDTLLSAMAVT